MSQQKDHHGAEACIADVDCTFMYKDQIIEFVIQSDWLTKSVRQVKEDLLAHSNFGTVTEGPQELSLHMNGTPMNDHIHFGSYYNNFSDTDVVFELKPIASLQ